MKRIGANSLAAAAAAALAGSAGAQSLNDDFDCYQAGAAVSTLPGWELWLQPPGREAFVTDEQAFSGGRSLHLSQALADVVHRVHFDQEMVTFSVMTYVPSTSVGLEAYVITLSQYDGSGPATNWSVQVKFDTDLGHLEAQFRAAFVPLIYDRWVELRAELNLGEGAYDLYYDGDLRAQRLTWLCGDPGPCRGFAAVDFYVDRLESGPGMYVDDVLVTKAGATIPPSCGTTCYADCDSSGEVDFFDFLCFQNHFAAADPRADCDQDGELTFFDFLCFQHEFATGCP